MAVAFQILNPDGTVKVDLNSRVLRVLNPSFSGAAAGGSVTLPANQGTIIPALGNSSESGGSAGDLTISGNTVSWGSGAALVGAMLVF